MLASASSSSESVPRRHSFALDPPHSSSASAHPALNRRHSLSLSRKPLRSSPLTGPVLSSVDDENPTTRFARVSSTPSLPSRVRFDPPPSSPRQHARARSRSSNMALSISSTNPRPPSFPGAVTAPSSNRVTSAVPVPPSRAASVYSTAASDSGHNEDNWLTSTPYSSTPRFSRLGLAASNVVLPVSARESRRKSLRGEGGKRVSLVHPAPVMSPRGSESQSQADTASSASTPSLLSRLSLSSEAPTTSSTASSFGTDSVELTEIVGDLALMSPDDFGALSSEQDPVALGKAHNTWSLSMRRLRRSHTTGASVLSFGSGESSPTSAFSPLQSPAPSYLPTVPPTVLETYIIDSETSNAHGSKGSDNSNAPRKVAETVRRLFRSLSGVARRRA
ncbi:hypothetical protein B0H19DRAFT_1331780 [Mycena capillaripes]|nr:hypothetical protein B0H19DRAFT_1331780 [Mycena capillaripes]